MGADRVQIEFKLSFVLLLVYSKGIFWLRRKWVWVRCGKRVQSVFELPFILLLLLHSKAFTKSVSFSFFQFLEMSQAGGAYDILRKWKKLEESAT